MTHSSPSFILSLTCSSILRPKVTLGKCRASMLTFASFLRTYLWKESRVTDHISSLLAGKVLTLDDCFSCVLHQLLSVQSNTVRVIPACEVAQVTDSGRRDCMHIHEIIGVRSLLKVLNLLPSVKHSIVLFSVQSRPPYTVYIWSPQQWLVREIQAYCV